MVPGSSKSSISSIFHLNKKLCTLTVGNYNYYCHKLCNIESILVLCVAVLRVSIR